VTGFGTELEFEGVSLAVKVGIGMMGSCSSLSSEILVFDVV